MTWFDPYRVSSASVRGVRHPAVAGAFYPANAARLEATVTSYLHAAHLPRLQGHVRAVIAPHAGYIYSGPVAGYSFGALAPLPENATVFLMGPAHYVPVSEVAAGDFRALETPLGQIPVNGEVVQELVDAGSCVGIQNDAHLPEHSLEVELPFLQMIASGDFSVAPLLMGQPDVECAARALLPVIKQSVFLRVDIWR